MDAAIVKQHLAWNRRNDAPRRVRDEPPKELRPEFLVSLIFERLAQPPAPWAARGKHGCPSAAIILGDQERQLLVAVIHLCQNYRARLRCSGFLIIHQVGKLFPAFHVLRGVFHEPRDDIVGADRSKLHSSRIAVECALLVRKDDRKQVRQARDAPTSITQRSPAAEQEQAPAAAIHKLLDQLLCSSRKIIHFTPPYTAPPLISNSLS